MLIFLISCNILTSITPDHSDIKLQLRNLSDNYVIREVLHVYWKFNNSLCEADSRFLETMLEKNKSIKRRNFLPNF